MWYNLVDEGEVVFLCSLFLENVGISQECDTRDKSP
jgi:hypothetical protein